MKAIISSTHDPLYQSEEWRPIERFIGEYEVSNLGRIRSLDRWVKTKNTQKFYKGQIKAICVNPNRYLTTSIKNKTIFVHVEVARAFIPNPLNKKEVNHIDGDKSNCHVSNLEWATRHENIAHAFINKLIVTPRGEFQSNTKLTTEQVVEIFNSKDTVRALGKKYGVNHSAIVSIKIGKTWNHVTGLPRHRSIKNKFIK